jgi:CDP-diacylglycerol---glycerol-3-phosphate 3-phosphatidyltransferase
MISMWVLASVFGAGLVSMAIYALGGRRRDADQEGKGGQFFLGVGDFLLHWFMWAISPAVRASLALGLTPDFYNYLGLLLGLAGGVFLALGSLEAAGWAIALCGVADILDGRIARATGVASGYGDFIDSTFDRFVEVFVFLGWAWELRGTAAGPLLAGAAMGGSLVVSYVRARGEVLGVLCTGGLMQRGERLFLICMTCLAEPALARYWPFMKDTLSLGLLAFLAATTAVTAAHRTWWIAARLKPGVKVEERAQAPVAAAAR